MTNAGFGRTLGSLGGVRQEYCRAGWSFRERQEIDAGVGGLVVASIVHSRQDEPRRDLDPWIQEAAAGPLEEIRP